VGVVAVVDDFFDDANEDVDVFDADTLDIDVLGVLALKSSKQVSGNSIPLLLSPISFFRDSPLLIFAHGFTNLFQNSLLVLCTTITTDQRKNMAEVSCISSTATDPSSSSLLEKIYNETKVAISTQLD